MKRRRRRRRLPDRESDAHLDYVARLPCCVCGRSAPSDPAHIRIDIPPEGQKGGAGLKTGDRYAVPLCRSRPSQLYLGCHGRQHGGERSFWIQVGADAHELAAALWEITGDIPGGIRVVIAFRKAHQGG